LKTIKHRNDSKSVGTQGKKFQQTRPSERKGTQNGEMPIRRKIQNEVDRNGRKIQNMVDEQDKSFKVQDDHDPIHAKRAELGDCAGNEVGRPHAC
jgi:hypothetical protein